MKPSLVHRFLIYLEDKSTRSAGKKVLFNTLTISPTVTSFHRTLIQFSPLSTSTFLWFVSSSALCLFYNKTQITRQNYFIFKIVILTTSSIISFIADTASIKIRGTRVVYRPVGDTSGICWSSAIIKKKTFAHLRNCSNKKNGINLTTLKKTYA